MAPEGRVVRKFLTVTTGLAALASVSACSHIEDYTWKGREPAKVVDAHTGAPERQIGAVPVVSPAAATAPAPREHNFPLPTERDLFVVTDKLSDSSVQIFDVNSAQPYGTRGGGMGVASVTGAPMVSSSDSSVEIYPVGGSYAGAMDQTWPNSLYPANTLTPIGGGSASSAGRASPHVGSGYVPSQIFFKHGSARIGGGDKQVLRQVADQAKFAPVDRIRVEGHASTRTGVSDPVESKIVNLKESMNRAFNVSSTLMREGVPAEKIQTTVWGDTRNSGDEAHNRRVDIITGGQ